MYQTHRVLFTLYAEWGTDISYPKAGLLTVVSARNKILCRLPTWLVAHFPSMYCRSSLRGNIFLGWMQCRLPPNEELGRETRQIERNRRIQVHWLMRSSVPWRQVCRPQSAGLRSIVEWLQPCSHLLAVLFSLWKYCILWEWECRWNKTNRIHLSTQTYPRLVERGWIGPANKATSHKLKLIPTSESKFAPQNANESELRATRPMIM